MANVVENMLFSVEGRHVIDKVFLAHEVESEVDVAHEPRLHSQEECTGFAPDASLYFVRVFDSSQASTTAWFLEGFNYALRMKVDLISLSVGGPDYRDAPFVAKVR